MGGKWLILHQARCEWWRCDYYWRDALEVITVISNRYPMWYDALVRTCLVAQIRYPRLRLWRRRSLGSGFLIHEFFYNSNRSIGSFATSFLIGYEVASTRCIISCIVACQVRTSQNAILPQPNYVLISKALAVSTFPLSSGKKEF